MAYTKKSTKVRLFIQLQEEEECNRKGMIFAVNLNFIILLDHTSLLSRPLAKKSPSKEIVDGFGNESGALLGSVGVVDDVAIVSDGRVEKRGRRESSHRPIPRHGGVEGGRSGGGGRGGAAPERHRRVDQPGRRGEAGVFVI